MSTLGRCGAVLLVLVACCTSGSDKIFHSRQIMGSFSQERLGAWLQLVMPETRPGTLPETLSVTSTRCWYVVALAAGVRLQ